MQSNGEIDDFQLSVQEFEKRLGGVKLSDLEEGIESSVIRASRSLRKEFLKMRTADIYLSQMK